MGMLTEILRGGAEKVFEAGAVIAGGHTVMDKEPKYGLAVTGTVHPDKIVSKQGAQPGDSLILTKPLGTGTITTALKNQVAHEEHVAAAVASMSRLNRNASRLAQAADIHAMTDITGYALLGHSCEMVSSGDVDFHITFSALKWLPGANDYARRDIFPGGAGRNRHHFEQWVQWHDGLQEFQKNLLFDPQTSGGLLIAVEAERAEALLEQLISGGDNSTIVGQVHPGSGSIIVFP
jgi:selenide,water dikinase